MPISFTIVLPAATGERNAAACRAGEPDRHYHARRFRPRQLGHTSPTYFPSPARSPVWQRRVARPAAPAPRRIRGYVTVNPNYPSEALAEINRCLDAAMVGIKLAASRRADDPLVDPIWPARRGAVVPVLHHVWQSGGESTRDRKPRTPGSSASSRAGIRACSSCSPYRGSGGLAPEPPGHSRMSNVMVESLRQRRRRWDARGVYRSGGGGAGSSGGPISRWRPLGEAAHLEHLLTPLQLELVRWGNAVRIFPSGAFPSD